MLNTKSNLKRKKLQEALEETITSTDPMLFLEMVSNIRDTSNNIIGTINMGYMSSEEITTLYKLAEVCSFTLDKIFNIVIGIDEEEFQK